MCQTSTAQESGPASSDIPEEIVVYGKRSLIRLRQELYAAEEKFFAAFNAHNSNDVFDVYCNYVWHIEQRRRIRECRAKFQMVAESDFVLGFNPNLATILRKEKLLAQEMRTQVSEHRELLQVFTELAKAKQDYDSERQRR